MSIDIEKIAVVCPKCGEEFAEWYQPSLDPAATATCPACDYRLSADPTVRTEGPFLPDDQFGDHPEP
jgi:hypothetical protein